ncbi:MAG: hypothetical protein PHT40_00675 [Patescibacteria group bacterium]|nr:hypothetical protein [Patescibacteria group bacterium]
MDPKTYQPTHNYQPPEKAKKSKKAKWLGRLFFLVLIAAVIVVLFGFVLPTAEVTVYFSSTDLSKDYEVVLDQNLNSPDSARLSLPARVYEETGEEQKKFQTTGKKDMGDKASGSATFFNYTGRPYPLTPTVELNHSSGKIYILKSELTIPAATVSDTGEIVPGKIQGDVEGKDAGDSFNQAAGRLNLSILTPELQSKVYADVGAISGGTSKLVSVISQEDLDNAQNELSNTLTLKLKTKIRDRLKKNEEMMRDELTNFEILSSEKSVELDKEAKDFDMKITGKLKTLAFNETELKNFLKTRSLTDLPSDKMIAEDDLGELQIAVDQADFSLGVAKLKVKATYKTFPKTDLSSLRDKIKGLSEVDARRLILGTENIRDVHFSFSFNLWNKLPTNVNKIKIKVGNK